MSKTVSQKMGLKEGMRAFFQKAPASALRAMKLPELNASQTLRREFDAAKARCPSTLRWAAPVSLAYEQGETEWQCMWT